MLIKKVKNGLRRCLSLEWKAKISGKAVVISETQLETMYKGNTPYPIAGTKIRTRTYSDQAEARLALELLAKMKSKEGYRSKHTKLRPVA